MSSLSFSGRASLGLLAQGTVFGARWRVEFSVTKKVAQHDRDPLHSR